LQTKFSELTILQQGGSSTNEPTQAIPAAIAQDTTLLLGLWASGGQGALDAEITALNTAITQWGEQFTSLVAGISVGSEDLYRISPTGIAADSGYGADPDTLAAYIGQVKAAIKSAAPTWNVQVGHVDTWTAWVNSSNQAVIDASDFIGMDAYPYFQNTMVNSIETGEQLFNDAFDQTKAAVGGKDVWITETGWPVSGKTEGQAVPSVANAQTYWDQVGCPNFGVVNTYWYTLEDTDAAQTNPSFGIAPGNPLSSTPFFDLSCKAVSSSSSSTGPTSSATPSTSASVGTGQSSVSLSVSSSVSPSTSTSSTSNPASSPPPQTTGSANPTSSSASSVSTSVVATGGSGLSPGGGAGNGIGSPSGTGAAPSTITSATGGSGVNGTSTGLKTTAKPTGSGTTTGTSTAPLTQSTNGAALFSGSIGAMGALVLAAVVAL
jgi:glucan endo-1,3-beta-D-glucosidase